MIQLRPVCVCEECGWEWRPDNWRGTREPLRLPDQCPNRECRSRAWNASQRPDDKKQERRDLISEEW